MHSKVCPQLAGGKRCHSKARFCRLIPAGETGQSHQLQRRSGCPLARPSPHSRIPQELLHFSCSFALRPPHSPGVVPVTNIHPRAGSGIPNPVFWLSPSAPGGATGTHPPPTAPGAARAMLKIFGCCNQHRKMSLFPGNVEGSLSSPPGHRSVLLCPIFPKG